MTGGTALYDAALLLELRLLVVERLTAELVGPSLPASLPRAQAAWLGGRR